MRTDLKLDRRKIPCPNASLLGHAYGAAKPGHCITFHQDGHIAMGRVLGRITAPREFRKWALVLVLSNDGTFCMERWVDPKDITRVYDPPVALVRFFFGAFPCETYMIRRLCDHGTLSDQHVHNVTERIGMFIQRDHDAALANRKAEGWK